MRDLDRLKDFLFGSVAGVAMIAAVGYAAKLKLAKSAAAKK